MIRPVWLQRCTQLPVGERAFFEEFSRVAHEASEVDTSELGDQRAARIDRSVQDRLNQRSQGKAVASGDKVDGPAHQGDADHLAICDQLSKLVRSEFKQPCPKSDVRRVRSLGLQPDQLLDRCSNGQSRATKE